MSVFRVGTGTKNHIVRRTGVNTQYIARCIKPFVQPVLTDNGTMGGNSFACDQEAYYDSGNPSVEPPQYFFYLLSNEPHEWQINTVDVNKFYWVKFYNPNPLVLSAIAFQNTQTIYAPEQIKIYGSNDNSAFELIGQHLTWPQNAEMTAVPLNGTQKPWKYFMVEIKPRDATAVMLGKMQITAKEVF